MHLNRITRFERPVPAIQQIAGRNTDPLALPDDHHHLWIARIPVIRGGNGPGQSQTLGPDDLRMADRADETDVDPARLGHVSESLLLTGLKREPGLCASLRPGRATRSRQPHKAKVKNAK